MAAARSVKSAWRTAFETAIGGLGDNSTGIGWVSALLAITSDCTHEMLLKSHLVSDQT